MEWFPRFEILNPWSPTEIPPLLLSDHQTTHLVLDKSTRYLMQQLQDRYFNKPSHNWNPLLDQATTEKCHVILNALWDASSISHGRAERANLVLQGMQSFYSKSSLGFSNSLTMGQLRQQVQLPLPTSETYFKVLRLFSIDTTANPYRAMEIVQEMQKYYEEYGQLDLQPTILHWNLVLCCWASWNPETNVIHQQQQDEQQSPTLDRMKQSKAFQAAHLLQRLKEMDSVELNVSSFEHSLRACFPSSPNSSAASQASNVEIALRIYSELQKHEETIQPTPFIYTYFLRALAPLSKLAPSTSFTMKLQQPHYQKQSNINQLHDRAQKAAVIAFHDAVKAGCVNTFVVDNFRQAVPSKVLESTVRPLLMQQQEQRGIHHRGALDPLSTMNPARILSQLPPSAKRNAS